MKRRIEAKVRKAIRGGEHHNRGLRAAVKRRVRSGLPLCVACRDLVLDSKESWAHRMFLAKLLSGKFGRITQSWRVLVKAALDTDSLRTKAEVLRFCSNTTQIGSAELQLLWQVIAGGSLEEQIEGMDGLAFVECRPVRLALIEILENRSLSLAVRERALEMLHLQPSEETVDTCARFLSAPEVSLRFWAAYTLGNSFFRDGSSAIAAAALETALDDREVAPGWWSVGREAEALLTGLRGDEAAHDRLQAKIRQIQADPHAAPEERRWAECYCREAPTQ
jgi:hypothetical protein